MPQLIELNQQQWLGTSRNPVWSTTRVPPQQAHLKMRKVLCLEILVWLYVLSLKPRLMMEIHLGFRAYRTGPIFALNVSKVVRVIKKLLFSYANLVFRASSFIVSCRYLDFSKNGSHLKKSVRKVEFIRRAKLVSFQHFSERLQYPNHLTHRKQRGISGKIMSISFI